MVVAVVAGAAVAAVVVCLSRLPAAACSSASVASGCSMAGVGVAAGAEAAGAAALASVVESVVVELLARRHMRADVNTLVPSGRARVITLVALGMHPWSCSTTSRSPLLPVSPLLSLLVGLLRLLSGAAAASEPAGRRREGAGVRHMGTGCDGCGGCGSNGSLPGRGPAVAAVGGGQPVSQTCSTPASGLATPLRWRLPAIRAHLCHLRAAGGHWRQWPPVGPRAR